RRASARLSALRDVTAAALEDVASALSENPVSAEEVAKATGGLRPMREGVARDVDEAQESSRGNPRVRAFRNDRDLIASRMRALEITTLAAQDLSDVLLRAEQDGALPDPTVRMSLVETVRACA